MVSTPFLMKVIDWILERLPEPAVDLDGPEFSPETNAIVVGYGRFGQTVAQMLMAKRIPVTIIDSKPSQIELSEEFGTKVYYGDGTRVDLLRTAGAETAEGILFCQNPKELTRDKLEAVFTSFPHAAIMARVYDRLQVIEFDGLDLAVCERELYESAVVDGPPGADEAGHFPARGGARRARISGAGPRAAGCADGHRRSPCQVRSQFRCRPLASGRSEESRPKALPRRRRGASSSALTIDSTTS